MEFDLLARAAIATGGVWLMVRWEAKRGNAAGCAVDLFDAILFAAAVGVFAGRIGAMVSAGISPISDPGQILLVRSGISTPVAAVAAIAVFAFVARQDVVSVADAASPSIVAGLAAWQGSCIVNASCVGTPTELPWAIGLPGSDVGRHPVEIYAALALGAIAIGLAVWKQRGRPPSGAIAGVALLGVSTVRLATEPMRTSLSGGPLWLYITGVIAGALTIAVSVRRSRQHRTVP